MRIREKIANFAKRVAKYIDSEEVILEMNGIVLLKSHDKDFDFKSTVVEEVQQYCSENGIKKVDRVVIISAYDADLHHRKQKLIFQQRTVCKSESKIVVIKEGKKVIAQVFFSEYMEIHGDN